MMRLLEVSILATLLLLPLAASFCPRVGIKRTHLSFTRPHATGKDHFDMDELRQRIADEKNPYRKLFEMDDATHTRPEDVHIILFKPDTEEEGVHTIEYPKGSGTNVILAFESKEECTRFAATLKAQHFFDPSPQEMNLQDLEDYCRELGVFVQVVPEGMELLPPLENVKELGHDPNLGDKKHHLDSVFDMVQVDEPGVVVDEGGSWE